MLLCGDLNFIFSGRGFIKSNLKFPDYGHCSWKFLRFLTNSLWYYFIKMPFNIVISVGYYFVKDKNHLPWDEGLLNQLAVNVLVDFFCCSKIDSQENKQQQKSNWWEDSVIFQLIHCSLKGFTLRPNVCRVNQESISAARSNEIHYKRKRNWRY